MSVSCCASSRQVLSLSLQNLPRHNHCQSHVDRPRPSLSHPRRQRVCRGPSPARRWWTLVGGSCHTGTDRGSTGDWPAGVVKYPVSAAGCDAVAEQFVHI